MTFPRLRTSSSSRSNSRELIPIGVWSTLTMRAATSTPAHGTCRMNYATQPASGYGMAFRASSWPMLLSAHRKLTRAPF
jgi:hypothetical protein